MVGPVARLGDRSTDDDALLIALAQISRRHNRIRLLACPPDR
jgi:hypothetical protein